MLTLGLTQVTVAKKIAKDMEKWAKTLNQRKESTKVAAPAPEYEPEDHGSTQEQEPASAASLDTTLDEVLQVMKRKQQAEKALLQQKKKKPLGPSALVSYGSDHSDDEGNSSYQEDKKSIALELEQMVDFTKLACLLCKRQFANRETLAKHQQLSDLHKQNVEAWKKERAATLANRSKESYRDRAKERRQKFGEPEPPRSGYHHHRKSQVCFLSSHIQPLVY